ncbi:response regulator [Bosea sp. 124]|uniref:response regulator n=1 Tax=Bosea sp. 124 TaxID=2135642 RepID=UPI000D39A819|nr:response regulator [Bosea sp. 124]PTM39558.1 response regulator receiver domain-containing protein [Bosea sp. 124]
MLILLVEDEPLILMDVESALIDAGFEVIAASNGEDAVGWIERRGAEIRAVLTDIRLGGRLSGWDVGRHARQTVPTMPVVYVSGDSAGDWTSQGVPSSVMIQKPFAFAQIISAVSLLMNQSDQIGHAPSA